MRTYAVLRDLSGTTTSEPHGGAAALRALETPAEPRVEVEQLDKRDVRTLARDPEVRALAPVMPTKLIRPFDVDPAEAATSAWGIGAVGAHTTARTGSGCVVAVLDTGIDASHPAFSGVELTQRDFSGSGDGDVQGHGTHCAGTVFGRDVDGTRIGVARGVERALIGKVLGDDGGGSSDMIFQGITWALDSGARVISMSLGYDFPGYVQQAVDAGWPADLATSLALEAYRANLRMFDALMQVARSREAFGAGALILAAAGNESRRDDNPEHELAASLPAAAEGVVSVGALAQSPAGLQVAPFSNTFCQLSAPGVDVLSARSGGGLVSFSGTSMATPHVAGVAALWWEQVVDSAVPLSTRAVTAKLMAAATHDGFAEGVDPVDRGLGIVQAPRASGRVVGGAGAVSGARRTAVP